MAIEDRVKSLEERMGAVERTSVIVTEALRFNAEQVLRRDAEFDRFRAQTEREHENIRTEAFSRWSDHEDRMRRMEKALWTLTGLTSGTFLAVVVPAVLKALT